MLVYAELVAPPFGRQDRKPGHSGFAYAESVAPLRRIGGAYPLFLRRIGGGFTQNWWRSLYNRTFQNILYRTFFRIFRKGPV